jgi:hypothetical protein
MITKREYNKRMADLERRAADNSTKQKELIASEQYDGLRALYDEEYEIRDAIKGLQGEWDTRKWTASDWNSWDLITSNID